jgi:uncharacterized membrane protein
MTIFLGIIAILLPVAAGVWVWNLKKLAAVFLTTGFLLFVCFQLVFIFSNSNPA